MTAKDEINRKELDQLERQKATQSDKTHSSINKVQSDSRQYLIIEKKKMLR